MSIETDIANALGIRAATVATALGLQIAMPNVPFPPPNHPEYAESKYLEVRHFRNSNLNPTWGDEKTLLGIYQISVIDPLQAGEVAASAIGSQVIDGFAKGTNLYQGTARIVIYEHPTLLTTVQSGQKSIYPVSIPYRCFKA